MSEKTQKLGDKQRPKQSVPKICQKDIKSRTQIDTSWRMDSIEESLWVWAHRGKYHTVFSNIGRIKGGVNRVEKENREVARIRVSILKLIKNLVDSETLKYIENERGRERVLVKTSRKELKTETLIENRCFIGSQNSRN